ncbi:MAG: RNA polymerase sigma factor [Calditerrivibrio sp.]|nr:RNA polymerase sigma factor [Calditerrivibrio sp.]MCA1981098.1 RNA polymerase sigma factor [Calditerrivibrio sp.]
MDSFEVFFEKTKKGFYNYILSLSRDEDVAKDIVQESYYKLLKSYKLDYSVNLLYKIGKNLYFDEYNRKKNHTDLELVDGSYNVNKDNSIELAKIFSMLDDDEKKIFSMVVLDDMSYDEISKLTGISVSNIKVKIHRARKKINEIFKGA